MAKSLIYIGLGVLAGSVWLAIAESSGWVASGGSGSWVPVGVRAGAACLAGGIVLGVLRPVFRRIRQGRCVRCGAPIERGQTYCLDHLQATLNEYRDQTRAGILTRPGPRP